MSNLLRPDLNQIHLDVDGFLGQAIALGRRYEKLPERFLDALMAYLRVRGRDHARRYRTEIRIDRDLLEQGIQQSVTCVELSLKEASGDDLNAAVEILAGGDFESLRQRGWEIAFGRLEEMRQEAILLCKRPEVALLQEFIHQIQPWTQIIPETWTGVDAEGETVEVDPQEDFAVFEEIRGRMDFLRSLPREPLRQLLAENSKGETFGSMLRRLIVAVATDQESLAVDDERVLHLQENGFTGGRMRPEMRGKILEQIAAHLQRALGDEGMRALILEEVKEEITRLEDCSEGGLEEWFHPPGKPEEVDIDRAGGEAESDAEAREAADMDMGGAWEFEEFD